MVVVGHNRQPHYTSSRARQPLCKCLRLCAFSSADFYLRGDLFRLVYVAFVTAAPAGRIVGWRVSRIALAGFVLDAREHALHERRARPQGGGLVPQSDRGVQYTSRSTKPSASPKHRALRRQRRRLRRQRAARTPASSCRGRSGRRAAPTRQLHSRRPPPRALGRGGAVTWT